MFFFGGRTRGDTGASSGPFGSPSSFACKPAALICHPHHRQPSRCPVDASRLLSVSEASVCSVDMDERSLMDDDWDGEALLLTAASVLRKPGGIKPRHNSVPLHGWQDTEATLAPGPERFNQQEVTGL